MSITDILALAWLIAGGLYFAQLGLSVRQSLFAIAWDRLRAGLAHVHSDIPESSPHEGLPLFGGAR